MSAVVTQITIFSTDYQIVCSGADQSKHQSSAQLAFVTGIDRWIPRTRASNAANIYIWWRHHVCVLTSADFGTWQRLIRLNWNAIVILANNASPSIDLMEMQVVFRVDRQTIHLESV